MARALAKGRFVVGVVSCTAVMSLLWLLLWATAVPVVRGWSPVAVLSGSMGPSIDTGDIVIAAPPGNDTLGPGTVIVFDNPAASGSITHRVVAVNPAGDYVTHGDANARVDSTPVPPEAISGVGRILVPVVGMPFVWADNDRWLHVVAAFAALFGALWASRWALLARFNPWLEVSSPAVGPSVATIEATLGIWHGEVSPWSQRPSVGLSPRELAALRRTARLRSPRRSVALTFAMVLVISAVVAGGSVFRAQAAFSGSSATTGSAFSLDTLVPPTSVTATGGATVNVNWTATTDTYATGHRIYRATTSGGPYTLIAQVTPRTTTTYQDSPPSPGTYYYVVRAHYLNWESTNSNEASAAYSSAPAPPTNLTATNGFNITLNWTATPSTFATGHRIYRSTTSGGPYTLIATVTPRTTTTYQDKPTSSATYYYVVRSFYLAQESTNSNQVSVTYSCQGSCND